MGRKSRKKSPWLGVAPEDLFGRRSFGGEANERERLPIKRNGLVVRRRAAKPDESDEGSDDVSSEYNESGSDIVQYNQPNVQLEKETGASIDVRKLSRKDADGELRLRSSIVMANPEESVSELSRIRDIAVNHPLSLIRRRAVVVLGETLGDVLPDYNIRKHDMLTKLSKDVRKLQQFETDLLQQTAAYVQIISKIITRRSEDDLSAAIYGASAILSKRPHSNYWRELCGLLVDSLFIASSSANLLRKDLDLCTLTFKNLFKADLEGEISLHVANLIKSKLEAKRYRNSKTLQKDKVVVSFRDMNLATGSESKSALPQHPNKRQKLDSKLGDRSKKKILKHQRDIENIEKSLKEADAEIDEGQRDQRRSKCLHIVFETYISLLADFQDNLESGIDQNYDVLEVCLDGLCKFADSVNIDLFSDIMNGIRIVLTKVTEKNDYHSVLLCTATVFRLVHLQRGLTTELDLSYYVKNLYASALNISFCSTPTRLNSINTLKDFSLVNTDDVSLFCICIWYALIIHRESNNNRVASFLKRLLLIVLCSNENNLLCDLIEMIFKRHKSLHQMLLDEESIADGIYNPFMDDPDLALGRSTKLWEAHLLWEHYSQSNSKLVSRLQKII